MLVGFGKKWILTEHIFLVVKPARESRRLLWCIDGGVLFKRANLFWALLWNDNSLSCCRWSRRSFGQQGQSESNMRALRRFTGPAVPMPRCCRSCQKCRLQGVRGGEDSIPAGRGMVFLSRLWRIYGCLRVFAPSFEFGCRSELNWVFCVHFLVVCCVPMEDAGVCNYSSNKTWIWSTCLRLNSVQSSMADNKGKKLADSACDDTVRRSCLMGRYSWVRCNSLELFSIVGNDMNYHTAIIGHVTDERIINKISMMCICCVFVCDFDVH